MAETFAGIHDGDFDESGEEAFADLGPGFEALDASAAIIDEFTTLLDEDAEADDDMVLDTGYGVMRLEDIHFGAAGADELEH